MGARVVVALVAAGAVLAAGCGGASEEQHGASDAQRVRDSMSGYVQDLGAGDVGKACAHESRPDQCTEAFATAKALGIDAADLFRQSVGVTLEERFNVKSAKVTVTGDHATMRVPGGSLVEFVKVDGEWKVASGTP